MRSLPMFLAITALTVFSLPSEAAETEFNFKDPKGVNAMAFVADSDLEPITGTADGITGTVKFDPEKPKATTGTISVAASTVMTTNNGMTRKLHSDEWMDVEKHEKIEFKLTKVLDAKSKGDVFTLAVEGTFTMKGVTKPLKTTVELKHLPGRLGDRMRGKEGDLLVLRTKFKIKRSEFSLGPDYPVVNDEIDVTVAIVGLNMKE